MAKKLLIIDSDKANRQTLCDMLHDDYEAIEAESCTGAFLLMHNEYNTISAVLLDITANESDGFDMLRKKQADPLISQIPVIAITDVSAENAQIRALKLGATDIITKPLYSEIIKSRLKNAVSIYETSSIISSLQKDALTGLCTRNTFFAIASEMISSHEPGYYVMSCFDIDKFKIINDQYGTKRGDEILKYTAKVLTECFSDIGGICARFTSDDFAVLYPYSFISSERLAKIIPRGSLPICDIPHIGISIGRYIINDLSLNVSGMYDRAIMALSYAKKHFDKKIVMYDESMRTHLLFEQEIISEMRNSLDEGQFQVWFQPQYNHTTGALIGSEALVRWMHPIKGLIKPNDFIPIFERNGFVYALDKYVWEQVCVILRNWINDGRSPLPISVNVSGYDALSEDFYDVITGIVQKYEIPIELFRIEITESAFSESAEKIICVFKKLIEYGFTVEIDDFGSGYSSLNTLKDVPAQVLKLDMRFFEETDNTDRSGNIIESIVRMGKWLGMAIIAEGVETKAQADYLKSIGCIYVQGYLYAKPIPFAEYESLAHSVGKEEKLLTLETVENLNNNRFWNPESIDTLIFNSFVGSACIVEYYNGQIEIIRTTDKFVNILGSTSMSVKDVLKLDWQNHLDKNGLAKFDDIVTTSLHTKDEVTDELIFNNLPGCPKKTYLRVMIRAIAGVGKRIMLYCANENVTAQRTAEKQQRKTAQRLQTIMQNMNDSTTKETVVRETIPFILSAILTSSRDIAFAKDRDFKHICCSTEFIKMARHDNVIGKTDYELFPKEVADRFRRNDLRLLETGKPSIDYIETIPSKSGILRYFKMSKYILRDLSGNIIGIYGTGREITEEREAYAQLKLLTNNIPGGMATYVGSVDRVKITYFNDAFCDLFGYTREEYEKISSTGVTNVTFAEDVPLVMEQVKALILHDKPINCTYRIHTKDGGYKWVNLRGTIAERHGDICMFNSILFDVSDSIEKENKLRLSEEQFRIAADISGQVISRYDFKTSEYHHNDKLLFEYGFSDTVKNVPQAFIEAKIIPPEFAQACIDFFNKLRHGEKSCNFDSRICYKDGSYRWHRLAATVAFDSDGNPSQAIIVTSDITEQLEKEAIYQKWNQSLNQRACESYMLFRYNLSRNSFSDSAEGSLLWVKFSPEITDFDELTQEYIHQCLYADDREAYTAFLNSDTLIANYYRGIRTKTIEYREQMSNSSVRWLRLTVEMVEYPGTTDIEAFLLYEDINESKQNEMRNKELAENDPLTGILNRVAFSHKIEQLFTKTKSAQHVLLMLDIDCFKHLNDTLGHATGDLVLISVANSLRHVLRRNDLLGRLGGDEFLICLTDFSRNASIEKKAAEICTAVRNAFNSEMSISTSIGIAVYPDNGTDFNTLYHKADTALYHVKDSGKDNFAFFDEKTDVIKSNAPTLNFDAAQYKDL